MRAVVLQRAVFRRCVAALKLERSRSRSSRAGRQQELISEDRLAIAFEEPLTERAGPDQDGAEDPFGATVGSEIDCTADRPITWGTIGFSGRASTGQTIAATMQAIAAEVPSRSKGQPRLL